MSDPVQITLIICMTIVACYIINCLKYVPEDKKEYGNERFGRFEYCKSPTYPKPPRPGSGSGTKDTSRLDEIFRRK